MSNKEEKEPKKESKKEQEVKNETTQIKKTHLAGGIFILFLMLMWPITGMIAFKNYIIQKIAEIFNLRVLED